MGTFIGSLVLLAEGIIGFWLMDGYHSPKWRKKHPEAGAKPPLRPKSQITSRAPNWWVKERNLPLWENIEAAFQWFDLVSFGVLLAVGAMALDLHQYFAARVFFGLAWTFVAIRLIAMSYKRRRGPWKWVCVQAVYVLAILGTMYLRGFADVAQEEQLVKTSQDAEAKHSDFMRTHKHYPEIYPWLNYVYAGNLVGLELLVHEAPNAMNTPPTLFHLQAEITTPIATDRHYLLSCVVIDISPAVEEWGGGDEKPIVWWTPASSHGVIFQTGLSERDGSWQGKLIVKNLFLPRAGIASNQANEIEQMFVRNIDAVRAPFSFTERYTAADGWSHPAYSRQNRNTYLSVEELEAVGVPIVPGLSTDTRVEMRVAKTCPHRWTWTRVD